MIEEIEKIVLEFKYIQTHLMMIEDAVNSNVVRAGMVLYNERYRIVCEHNGVRLYIVSKFSAANSGSAWHRSEINTTINLELYLTCTDYRFQIDSTYTDEEIRNTTISTLLSQLPIYNAAVRFRRSIPISERLKIYEKDLQL